MTGRCKKSDKCENEVAEVVDLFCGAGALSHGLRLAGLKILAGYDVDARCQHAFEKNNDASFFTRDVAKLTSREVKAHFSGKLPTVVAGCAPCQPFSSYKQRYEVDPQWSLVAKFAKIAVGADPDFITMENVPSLLRYRDGSVFAEFCQILEAAGYAVAWDIAKCEEFGVPQKRRRLVVIASKSGVKVELKKSGDAPLSVRQAIGDLPKLKAGQQDLIDPLHSCSNLNELNMRRIKASSSGGTWRDWPVELRSPCHVRPSGKTYPGVYARMEWDKPSPTMTTQCYGFGNGRFGHPDQDRAISLREAALLQSFPRNYRFLKHGDPVSFTELGRWIGNAVPVKLAEAIGLAIGEGLQRGGNGEGKGK